MLDQKHLKFSHAILVLISQLLFTDFLRYCLEKKKQSILLHSECFIMDQVLKLQSTSYTIRVFGQLVDLQLAFNLLPGPIQFLTSFTYHLLADEIAFNSMVIFGHEHLHFRQSELSEHWFSIQYSNLWIAYFWHSQKCMMPRKAGNIVALIVEQFANCLLCLNDYLLHHFQWPFQAHRCCYSNCTIYLLCLSVKLQPL